MKKYRLSALALAILLAFSAGAAFAQGAGTTGNIYGTVSDEQGQALSGVTVTLTGIDWSEQMLDLARQRAADLGHPATLQQADAHHLPFDDATFTISNVAGRVAHQQDGEPVEGEYVVGWAKRGPSGVIGTNKPDSVATVAAMVEDLPTLQGIPNANRDPNKIVELLKQRKPDFVTYDDWKVLDGYELARGTEQGRPRVKVTSVPEMLDVIRKG